MKDIIKRCTFHITGHTFYLTVWDTGRLEGRFFLKPILGYRLSHVDEKTHTKMVLFNAEDYLPGTALSADSDESIGGLMGFLTLRPGDTDSDYFKDYTPTQLRYCEQHAEELQLECMARFGEDV